MAYPPQVMAKHVMLMIFGILKRESENSLNIFLIKDLKAHDPLDLAPRIGYVLCERWASIYRGCVESE
jgi:hypothetical protein